jgi:hypothetical protein
MQRISERVGRPIASVRTTNIVTNQKEEPTVTNPSHSKAARVFALTLLAGLTLAGAVIGSQAQSVLGHRPPGVSRVSRQRPWRGTFRPAQAAQSPSSAPTWSPVFPAVSDPDLFAFRAEHSAVYDPGSNTMIVFGGVDQNFAMQSNVLTETNANGNGGAVAGAWSELPTDVFPFPPARSFHSAVYDQSNNRMIVFGGCADSECLIPLNDTWVLTNANGTGGTATWSQLNPIGTPPNPRANHNAVYDAANNRMMVFSGDNGSVPFSDVWVLSNANGLGGTPAWTQLSPTGGTPDAIDGSTAVYDPAANIMIVFSGGNFLNSSWILSNANGLGGTPAWTNLLANGAAGSPKGRIGAAAIYDSTSNRMTIYGGNSGGGITNPDLDFVALGDVWVLANANGAGGSPVWTQLHPKVAGDGGIPPVGREFFTAVRDPGTDSMIILGGDSIEGIYLSTWVLSHANGL